IRDRNVTGVQTCALPILHIALVRSSQIAATLGEVISRVGKERISRVETSRSVTLITGPSRTSDVELVLSIGVHGPKELHLIIIRSEERRVGKEERLGWER